MIAGPPKPIEPTESTSARACPSFFPHRFAVVSTPPFSRVLFHRLDLAVSSSFLQRSYIQPVRLSGKQSACLCDYFLQNTPTNPSPVDIIPHSARAMEKRAFSYGQRVLPPVASGTWQSLEQVFVLLHESQTFDRPMS